MSPLRPFRLGILVALLTIPLAAPVAADEPSDGDSVLLVGTVVDAENQPVAGVTVLLEASRKKFSLRHFENRQGEALQLPQRTDEFGGFRFEWVWDHHYNVFELAFGLEVNREGAPSFEIVQRRDISAEMSSGSPPALRIELEDVEWLRWLQLFIDGKASEDEKKIYQDLGRPQKLTVDGPQSSWWFFEIGKVYRLSSGRLEKIVPFEPIKDEAPPDP